MSTNHAEIAIKTPEPYRGTVTMHGTPKSAGQMCTVAEAANYFDLPPVLDRYGDWAICADGIHCLYINYQVAISRFDESDWIAHVTEKDWVVASDFIAAFKKAKEMLAS